MIHNPWTFSAGDADSFRKTADDLNKFQERLVAIYAEKTGLESSEIQALMDAETWLTADEAVAKGFAGSKFAATKAAACAKDFSGALATKIFASITAGKKPHQKGENIMANATTDDILTAEAQVNDLKAKLATAEQGLTDAKAQRDQAIQNAANAVKTANKAAIEMVTIAKEHNKLDMALAHIQEGKSIDELKDAILKSYKGDNGTDSKNTVAKVLDADKEPADRDEFSATYIALAAKDAVKASAYLTKWASKIK